MSVINNLKNTLDHTRHSEGNVMTEESMDPSVGVAFLKDDNRAGQRGRSMVEMLGVLAIVGVLSVGGVYGYGVAMKKHKANELLHQASMLATTISAQIQSKGELPQSIEDFGNGKYGTFKKPEKANDEQFTMEITGMDSAVCAQVEKMAGGMVRKAECTETTLTLTYNNNLSSEKVAADYNGDADGCESSGRKYCANDTCIPATEECPVTGPTCPGNSSATEITDGISFTVRESGKSITCWCPAGQSYQSEGCANVPTTRCDDHTTNQCGLGYYCQFGSDRFANDIYRGTGICTKITGGVPISPASASEKTYLKGPATDWWSAYSWCIGNNMNSVTAIAGHNLNSSYSNSNGNGDLYTYFGQDITFWSGHAYDPYTAWAVGVFSTLESFIQTDGFEWEGSALCE